MGFGEDDEILQDFLVEAGELIEVLSEQLVDLEQRPNDKELLNAIFRGFHTVKGGAGFLQLHAMVECCHITENLFDILRNGKRTVTSELMDVVLQALDTVTNQYRQISNREEVQPASPALIKQLERLVSCEDLAEAAAAPAAAQPAAQTANRGIDISDDEFEGFLDAINPVEPVPPAASRIAPKSANSASGSDEISEDEFENLLDQLHGPGKGPGASAPASKSVAKPAAPAAPQAAKPAAAPAAKKPVDDFDLFGDAPAASGKDEITEDEFEALLDQLHGSGKAPSAKPASAPKAAPAAPRQAADLPPVASTAPSRAAPAAASSAPSSFAPSSPAASTSDASLISDDEFEDLLDQLHGKGKGPTVVASKPKTAAFTPAAKAPEPRPAEPKASAAPAANKAPAVSPKAAAPLAPKPVPVAAKAAASDDLDGGREGSRREGGSAAPAETTVRVDTQRLDDIMNMVGELVLVRNRLVRLGLETSDEAMQKAVANLDVVTGDLQSAVMKTRMQPIKKVFGRFPRVVRDLARNLKKEISLELVGEETDLDKNLVEALADPLVHLVRNSVDHGIEEPDVREKLGKPREGTVTLAAEQEGDHILLSITDDGAGMDPIRLRDKAVEKGLLDADAAARLTDVEAFNLIFAPGFSTKTEISDVSGRGVGMDVVKTKIAQLNGSIEIYSKVGEGTRFVIKVPLTLAIMPTLMIQLANQTFALPLVSVNEIFNMDLKKSNIVDGQECITIRDKSIPMYYLKDWLIQGSFREKKKKSANSEGHVVIVSVGTQRIGFVVDQLIGQEEVVIKPLGRMLQGTPGMAGATITGDGTIALILDVPSMLKRYAGGTTRSRVNVA